MFQATQQANIQSGSHNSLFTLQTKISQPESESGMVIKGYKSTITKHAAFSNSVRFRIDFYCVPGTQGINKS